MHHQVDHFRAQIVKIYRGLVKYACFKKWHIFCENDVIFVCSLCSKMTQKCAHSWNQWFSWSWPLFESKKGCFLTPLFWRPRAKSFPFNGRTHEKGVFKKGSLFWHQKCQKVCQLDRPFYILNLNRRTHFLIKNTFFSFFGFFFSLALLGWTPKTCHVFCTFFSRFFESPLFMSPLENPWILIKCCTFLVRKNCARKHVFLTF